MRVRKIAMAWLLLLGSSCALAHPHLTESTPADGAHLGAAPAQLRLHFSEGTQLTALWIQKGQGERQKLAPFPHDPRALITVTLPPLAPGDYLLSWRALGSDGHVAPGQIRFTIDR
jgi:methionine-rich copper-binding protein CopC